MSSSGSGALSDGSGTGAPDHASGDAAPAPAAHARSARLSASIRPSIRRLSTEAAELALTLDGLDLADLEEVDGKEDGEAERESTPRGGVHVVEIEQAPRSNTSDISAEVAELSRAGLNDRWAGAAAAPAPSPAECKSRRTSTHTFESDADRSSGSLFSTGSHGPFGPILGVLKGHSDSADGSMDYLHGEGDAGAGTKSQKQRRNSNKSVDNKSVDLGADLGNLSDEDSDDAGSRAASAAAGEVFVPSRGFNARGAFDDPTPSSPPRRTTPPARYDPEAIGKIIGKSADDDEADAEAAEEAVWSELGKYEKRVAGLRRGHNRRASDYAADNDADSAFEKEWGDMVAITAAGCGGGRVSGHTIRVACGVLAFTAAAVAVGIGTFAGVERIVSANSFAAGSAPTPIAEVSEEDRIQGALPTGPVPPPPPSDLVEVCAVEAWASDPASERRCRDACAAAECCFVTDESQYAAMSCGEEYADVCLKYKSYCDALDVADAKA